MTVLSKHTRIVCTSCILHTVCLNVIVKGHQQSILERKTASNSFLHTCTHGQRQSHKTKVAAALRAVSYSSLTAWHGAWWKTSSWSQIKELDSFDAVSTTWHFIGTCHFLLFHSDFVWFTGFVSSSGFVNRIHVVWLWHLVDNDPKCIHVNCEHNSCSRSRVRGTEILCRLKAPKQRLTWDEQWLAWERMRAGGSSRITGYKKL